MTDAVITPITPRPAVSRNVRWIGRIGWPLASTLFALALIGAWQLISDYRIVSPVFLPGPDRALRAMIEGFTTGTLGAQMLLTIERMIYGWVIASFVGVSLGALIGSSRHAREYLGPTLEFIRPLPASAIIPLMISFFGLSQSMVVGVVSFGTAWPMLLATVHGFSSVEPRLIELGRVLKLSRLQMIWKIALPSSMPDIFAAMRLGLTIALILSVVGEIIAGQNGLGLHILLASRAFRSPELFAGVMLLGLIGLVSNLILAALEQKLLRWRRP
jgi:sulfonate transport system permease protein